MSKIEIPSQFIKALIDVNQGDICTIRSEGELVPAPKDPTKEIWNFELELMNGKVKTCSFNKGSLRNLIKAWGDDSKNWVGKQIEADVVKVQAFGEVKNSIVWNAIGINKETVKTLE